MTPDDRRMTVREVSEALNVSERTIQRHAEKMGMTRNGFTTYLSENDVTRIKQAIERSGRTDLDNVVEVSLVTTSLEIEEMTLKVIAYHRAQADRLRAELALAAPKIEAAEALMVSERSMSVTDAAKHFGLHPRAQVFPYLRARGYLTAHDLPTQAAIDAGYLALRERRCPDGEVRKQSVVLLAQLDTWRRRVVPQIYAWIKETA